MRNLFVLIMTVLITMTVAPLFASELDSEVNSFQVELMHTEQFKKRAPIKRTVSPRGPRIVVQKSPAKIAEEYNIPYEEPSYVAAVAEQPALRSTYLAPHRESKRNSGLLTRATIMPSFAISIFDGADDSLVAPQGAMDAYQYGLSGSLSADLNIFNDNQFFLETGLAYLSLGSDTAQKSYAWGTTQNNKDQLKLSYLGLSLSAKWYASNPNESCLYFKAGGTPMFQIGKTYSNFSTLYQNENRFGTISTFDFALHGGAGYSYKLTKDINIIGDFTFYQGLISTMSLYSVYNAGFSLGLGASYKL